MTKNEKVGTGVAVIGTGILVWLLCRKKSNASITFVSDHNTWVKVADSNDNVLIDTILSPDIMPIIELAPGGNYTENIWEVPAS